MFAQVRSLVVVSVHDYRPIHHLGAVLGDQRG